MYYREPICLQYYAYQMNLESASSALKSSWWVWKTVSEGTLASIQIIKEMDGNVVRSMVSKAPKSFEKADCVGE